MSRKKKEPPSRPQKSIFLCVLNNFSSFYWHYYQLAGDTCLFQSAEMFERAAKRNLFDSIKVGMI